MDVTQAVTPEQEGIQYPETPAQDTEVITNELTPESVFEQQGNISDFFRANVDEEQPVEAEPETPAQVAKPEVNDEVRYQYWQSEADKAKNENATLKEQVQQLQTQSTAEQPQAPKQEESYDAFPPPPEKPKKPRGFNREEAWRDTGSDSGRYLDAVDDWRDQMDDYNRLQGEYNMAVMSEEKEALQKEREGIQKREAEKVAYDKNMDMMTNHLTKEYQASPDEIKDFVQVMDKPESITVDNLFQLYRMRNAKNVSEKVPIADKPIVQADSVTPPTESFDQLKRAQQVPSPMGVLPSSNQATAAGTPEDNVMDSMVDEYNKRNPWT